MTKREHARPSGESEEPSGPEPSYAERARTLVHLGRVGTLSTVSERHPEWPFGSVMPYGIDVTGSPTFLISTMAMHTRNVLRDPRASLLVTESGVETDPLGAGRVTLMGRVVKTPKSSLPGVREKYLGRYENASYWVDFKDFAFFQMEILDVYFVGGFGVMGWVPAEEYSKAEPDPLADASRGILEHMNEDHADSLILLARAAAGVEGEDARMTAVDRFGFHMRLRTPEGMKGLRIPFPREARTPEETRQVLVQMVREAREK
jgi:hypothetical protein